MGIGFPRRLVRSALGPKFQNTRAVENPNSEFGDAQLNALLWNSAGMGLVIYRADLVAAWNGSAFVIDHQAEAWNPENDQAHPLLTRVGTGVYRYTFAATYLDEDGIAQPVGLKKCGVRAMADTTHAFAFFTTSANLVVEVHLQNAIGAEVDAKFWLMVG